MAFTAADVKNLREMTGVGMMDCKKALTASDGDMDKAVEWLREKGMAASAKKAGRIAAEGMALATVVDGVGVVVEVNAETDFVGKNEKFVDFVKGVAATVAKENPADLDALMGCKYAGTELTVEQQQQEMVLVIGENIKVRRFARFAGQQQDSGDFALRRTLQRQDQSAAGHRQPAFSRCQGATLSGGGYRRTGGTVLWAYPEKLRCAAFQPQRGGDSAGGALSGARCGDFR